MLSGGFPGQIEALRQEVARIRAEGEEAKRQADEARGERALANVRASRRLFLGVAVGGVFGACAGGGAGYALASKSNEPAATGPAPTPDPRFEQLRQVAKMPLDDLL